MKKTIGLIIFLFFAVFYPMNRAGMLMMIADPIPMVFLVGAAGGLGLMRYSKGDGIAKVCKSLKVYLILCGLILTLVSAIIVCWNRTDWAGSGPAFAIAILPIFYGLILSCITSAFEASK